MGLYISSEGDMRISTYGGFRSAVNRLPAAQLGGPRSSIQEVRTALADPANPGRVAAP